MAKKQAARNCFQCADRPVGSHGCICGPQLEFYNWADQIHEVVFLEPRLQTSPINHALATTNASFSSGLVPTRLTLPTQAQAANSQDSHEWRLPTTSHFILGTIISLFSCCLQIPLQAMRTTAGNHRAQWQNSYCVAVSSCAFSSTIRFHSN